MELPMTDSVFKVIQKQYRPCDIYKSLAFETLFGDERMAQEISAFISDV